MKQALIWLVTPLTLNDPSPKAKIFAADIIDVDYDQRSANIQLANDSGVLTVQYSNIIVTDNTNSVAWLVNAIDGFYDIRADQTDAPQVPVAEVPAE